MLSNIRPYIFNRIEEVEVDFEKFKGQDKNGFKLIERVRNYKVKTTKENNSYHTAVFNQSSGPRHCSAFELSPEEIVLTSRNSGTFEKALKNHFGIIKYLKKGE